VAGSIARLFLRFNLNPSQQLALFRVRLLLSVRQFSKEPGKILGLVISAFVFVPISIGAGFGTGAGYLNLIEPWPVQLLGIVFVVLWIIWAVMPVLLFGSNEAMDMTRLLQYPLSKRDLVLSTFSGSLFDFTSYLLLPLFIAPFIRWGGISLPVLLILLIGLFICYTQLIVVNQLTLIAAGGVLRSRRFRDVMIVLLSLIGFSCYFVNQGIAYLFNQINIETISALRPLAYLQWLPTGAVARAIQLAEAEEWLFSVIWLGYSLMWMGLFLWVWQTLFRRIVTGQGFLHTGLGVKREEKDAERKADRNVGGPHRDKVGAVIAKPWVVRSGVYRLWLWIPYSVQQIFLKEIRAIWRVPQRRIGLIQGLLLPIFFTGPALLQEDAPQAMLGQYIWLILPVYAIFTTWVFSMNLLGWEGRSLATLLATPMSRWPLLLGKSLALLTLVLTPITFLTIAIIIYQRSIYGLMGWFIALGVTSTILGLMAIASVLFPYPVNLDSYRQQMSLSGGSCVASLVNTLVIPLLIGVITSPISGLIAWSIWRQQASLIVVAAIAAPIYGALLLLTGTYVAARLLSNREAEVLMATRIADGSS